MKSKSRVARKSTVVALVVVLAASVALVMRASDANADPSSSKDGVYPKTRKMLADLIEIKSDEQFWAAFVKMLEESVGVRLPRWQGGVALVSAGFRLNRPTTHLIQDGEDPKTKLPKARWIELPPGRFVWHLVGSEVFKSKEASESAEGQRCVLIGTDTHVILVRVDRSIVMRFSRR